MFLVNALINDDIINNFVDKQIKRIAKCNIKQKLNTLDMFVKKTNAYDVDNVIVK